MTHSAYSIRPMTAEQLPMRTLLDDLVVRTFDPELVNALVNDADVRPFIGRPDLLGLDMTAPVLDERNLFMIGAHGGFSAMWVAPGAYEIHALIMPFGRGRWALMAARDAIRYAFDHGARLLWARVADARRDVAAFARRMGFRPTGIAMEMDGEPYSIFQLGAI